MRRSPLAPILAATLALAGCVHVFHGHEVEEVPRPRGHGEAHLLITPIRAHLADGTIVVFPDSARISRDSIRGPGSAYSLGLRDTTSVDHVLMADVIGVENLRDEINTPVSLFTSLAATVSIPAALVAIACAADPKCFGSCPTVYSTSPDDTTLEAELFSYSIAPLLEGRDVDVLAVAASDGVLRLDVRNEALETHFINHLEILEVVHAPGERVMPDRDHRPMVLGPLAPPVGAVTADGRDVVAAVRARDAEAYETPAARLTSAMGGGELTDHITLTWPRPVATDGVALAIRLRNSLLTSVLFYDVMLGEAGASALEWMGSDLRQIGSAVQLGSWWSRAMGLRVSVLAVDGWREVVRIPDSGPIAWTHVAVPLPPTALGDDSVRVRLSFAADQWRIDRVMLAASARPASPRRVPAARMIRSDGTADVVGLAAIVAADEQYVETTAGTRFHAEFDVGPQPDDAVRTFLLSSQGFYNEWMRPSWLQRAPDGAAFEASDESLRRAMRLWLPIRPDFEARFKATRIPVK